MRKFEVGKEYQDYWGRTHKCIKRTDRSVWFDNGYRKGIDTDKDGNEVTTTIIRISDIKA